MLIHKGTTTIETTSLILRPFDIGDATDMFNNWANDPEVTKYLSWQSHSSIEGTTYLMGMWVDDYSSKDTYHWGIV